MVTTLQEADQVIRPLGQEEFSILRARGAVLLTANSLEESSSPLSTAIRGRAVELHSSRCGSFERALKILRENPDIAQKMADKLITHQFPLDNIKDAFSTAADSKNSIKVIIKTDTPTYETPPKSLY